MPWLQTGTTQNHAQLGLPNKGHAMKGLVICNNWDLEPSDLLIGLALDCYQPSPEELIVYSIIYCRMRKTKGWEEILLKQASYPCMANSALCNRSELEPSINEHYHFKILVVASLYLKENDLKKSTILRNIQLKK